jgi:tetratricopeptide (TPR) repeat protein
MVAREASMVDRDTRRQALKKRAQDVLRGAGGEATALFALAGELKALNEFGYARRLLTRAREHRVQDAVLRLKLAQRHALCTYKDPDLPMHEKLSLALEILTEVEDLRTTRDQETLGLAGAIYKRRWQLDTDKGHLERSLSYYHRGWEVGPETDFGYTGINAAYVLDLLARLEEKEAAETGSTSSSAQARRERAQQIRHTLVEVLPDLPSREGNAWLEDQWWFPVTVAEAHFGVGDYTKASAWLTRAKRLIDKTPPWEVESTAVQLASLAQLRPKAQEDTLPLEQSEGWRVLEKFLDNRADAVRTIFSGRLGLGLSGGGVQGAASRRRAGSNVAYRLA